MDDQLDRYHQQLNHPDYVLQKWYRRNAMQYELVSYVNIIIGLYLSKHFALIPIFLKRAWAHRQTHAEHYDATAYVHLLDAYFPLMTKYLLVHGALDESTRGYIPDDLLHQANTISS